MDYILITTVVLIVAVAANGFEKVMNVAVPLVVAEHAVVIKLVELILILHVPEILVGSTYIYGGN